MSLHLTGHSSHSLPPHSQPLIEYGQIPSTDQLSRRSKRLQGQRDALIPLPPPKCPRLTRSTAAKLERSPSLLDDLSDDNNEDIGPHSRVEKEEDPDFSLVTSITRQSKPRGKNRRVEPTYNTLDVEVEPLPKEDKKPAAARAHSAWKVSRANVSALNALGLRDWTPAIPPPLPKRASRPDASNAPPKSKLKKSSTKETELRQRTDTTPLRELTEIIGTGSTVPTLTDHLGISSSLFTKVLRIIAKLPAPVQILKVIKHPPPKTRPPVWAESRQELCETLPYYRAYQSGLYMHAKMGYGYLLDGFGAPRDIWAHEGRVIISHGGGQSTHHPSTARVVLCDDQSSEQARIDTLLQAARNRTPIVLLAGEGYELLPWEPGCTYWVSATWVEAEPVAQGIEAPAGRDYHHRYKIRFDWIDTQGDPWWIDEHSSTPSDEEIVEKMVEEASPDTSSDHYDSGLPLVPSGLEDMLKLLPVSSHKENCNGPAPGHLIVDGLPTPPITPPRAKDPMDHASPSLRSASSIEPIGHDKCEISSPTTATEIIDALDRPEQICPTCKQPSLQIYLEGWTCLIHSCPQFWLLSTCIGLTPIPPGISLTYHPSFLRHMSTPSSVKIPYSILPPLPTTLPGGGMGDRNIWKGFVCECGRANCRYRWETWECRHCGKQFGALTNADIVPPEVLNSAGTLLGNALVNDDILQTEIKRLSSPPATVLTYQLQGGVVYHIIPDFTAHSDALFQAYQQEAVSTQDPLFQRRALKANTGLFLPVKGQTLAQHFTLNSGAEYKYAVDTVSVSFEDSPACVMEALALYVILLFLRLETHVRLRTEALRVLGEEANFNEILSVLYCQGQKMNWHDDGEEGLGPIVASLSLGSQATMSFRRKTRRLRLPDGQTKVNAVPSLSITLSHGDVVIMQGDKLQRRYEHRVVPKGFRIAATARYIDNAQ
ncbi:hypothetical protein TREMEDRAFT_74716 [Tremella mesenterica DSM 1558]|uniref:uncharacterized protein n=1 Tax=Tremella mesenterica (strain ATCC 24925 / CBS 8224 / DSM 1558 / NBRC 9311 / NRRL Y-6157 / RJB 2259-6 / UBC 559-6) TaxID=578456 RepID=UPI00032CAEE0|nr:uncharacterized protein TREMEDRAFT_74716 [Tremella mesenterica DSM 1558]EIW66506.1 hypothetical protein TREMEDRAFT_74716 [Tremella mesenterica DSM 1558]